MNPAEFEKYVECRLEEWANWFSRGNHNGLGYPPHSIEYRLMTEAIIEKKSGPHYLPCNEDAEEIERLVKEMYEQNNTMALALRLQYFGQGKFSDRSKLINLRETQCRRYVELARKWIQGRLSYTSKKILNIA